MLPKLILLLLVIHEQTVSIESSTGTNPCLKLETCAACIQNPECAWCSQSDFHGQNKKQLPRCNTHEAHSQLDRFKCSPQHLFHHENFIIVERNESLSDGNNHTQKAVPIQPQKLSLRVRTNEPIGFSMRYKEVEDYPLDLYYLMDGTYTMKDDIETLVGLGDSNGQRLRRLTTKYRMGFGTFVDKMTMPFVSTIPEFFENPCFVRNDTCVKPYGFKNHMKLSNDTRKFSSTVGEVVLSASSDVPEGGFDALMQVMVCKKEIGWSEQARRLIIFATDAPFHYAGDGWLGGVLLPNDGHCHMDEKGEYYTHSLIYDYPSMAQINSKAKEHSMNIIFAVTSDQIDDYKRLQGVVEGSNSTELAKNSSNIVDLVEDEYKRIKAKVEIKDTFPSEFFQVRYYSACLDNEEMERTSCEGLLPGTVIQFRVEIELVKCPKLKSEWKQQYRVYAVGVPDSIDIDVEALCDCPCEDPNTWVPKSPLCNSKGTESCGLCICDDNYFGKNCECSGSGRELGKDATMACKMGNSSETCSGRGNCVCGQCNCFEKERYSGPYCECDNNNCPLINGQLCAGHGTCDCHECKCDPGWIGQGCECSTSKATCFEPGSEEECSGKGECSCGRCQCRGRYSGNFCEKCLHESCPNKCEELKHCVQCKMFETGVYNPSNCELSCFHHSIMPVDVISVVSGSDDVLCKAEDHSDECVFIFSYILGKDKTYKIKAQRTKECPPQAPIFMIVAIVSSIVVLIGLILLCAYQMYMKAKIKREYKAYEKERKTVAWGQETNPIYNSPIINFENPLYNGVGSNK